MRPSYHPKDAISISTRSFKLAKKTNYFILAHQDELYRAHQRKRDASLSSKATSSNP